MHSDAISRVANAFYVLYSRDPHLGAIGFVWNPLPSLLEVGMLTLYPLFPALATVGIAAVIQSSVFAGLTATLLYNAGRRFGLSALMSMMFALLYSLNPFIFLFGANGLSDAPYVYFLMMTVIQFSLWLKNRQTSALIVAGFALSLAFWTRYEAVPFGVSLALGVVIAVLWMRISAVEKRGTLKEKLYKVEATWILLLLPALFSGLLWIFFNYIIMGNPLYFLNSEYSNVAQSGALQNDAAFQEIFHSPLLALGFVLKKTLWFAIPLLSIMLLRLFSGRLFRWDMLILLLLFAAVPALQYLLLLRESSFGWFRYFMYVFPVTVAWIPYELQHFGKGARQRLAFTVLTAAMLGTAVLLSYAMTDPEIAPDENTFLHIKTGNEHYAAQTFERQIADYMDEHYPDATVLADSYSAYNIIVSSRYPRKYLITSDYLFKQAVKDPPGNDIDYILIPRPKENIPTSAVNAEFPTLYDGGIDWATLVHDFDGQWRLFKVKKWMGPDSAEEE
ncbi:glycosyltransferase family 39 protein [Paenibacillus sepulcri]|uniref:Glycosyltransferase family 39 protein n=2 Tax=Paenibacillus sepulcri TaxID=359917 RepID=A0ABS7C203_9BACL|nr:glycosyltransferase family 39 protein [Paenibacillus sepulcri]